MADLNRLVDELSALTILEASELKKLLEEKWGVTAASGGGMMMMAAGAAPAAAAAAAPEPVEEQTIDGGVGNDLPGVPDGQRRPWIDHQRGDGGFFPILQAFLDAIDRAAQRDFVCQCIRQPEQVLVTMSGRSCITRAERSSRISAASSGAPR